MQIIIKVRYLALLFTLFCTASSYAAEPVSSSNSPLLQKAIASNLHLEKVWTQLLHLQKSNRSPTGIESQVDDARYFLARDGKNNPRAELLASIDALLINVEDVIADDHPRCRFVSREAWLRERLNLPAEAVPEQCISYYEWRGIVGTHSMSLVFPASYLNSPSSMFGHTLLRLDPENIDESSEWLSWSLNFAADTGSENFSAGYAFKGIAGGYAGKFSSIPYFKKLQEYGAIENRDIWEYKLDFTEAELSRMLDHVWELRDIQFDYYFFRQNCSYRLLELMDYARPGLSLTEQFIVTTIPADTVKAVDKAGIVTDTHYRPSLGTGIQMRYQSIPRKLKPWVTRISNDDEVALSAEFLELDIATRAKIIRVANDLITYRSRRTSRSPETAKKRLRLLKMISKLPIEESVVPTPVAPEKAHDTRTANIGIGRANKTDYAQLGIRWSYHDVLDRNYGYLKGAGIALGDLQLRRDENDVSQLQSLELVKLQSYSDRALIFNTLSWDLSVGLTRDDNRLDGRLSAKAGGSIGKSTQVFNNTIGYGLLTGSMAQYSRLKENFVDVGVRLGLLRYIGGAAFQLEFKLETRQDESPRVSGAADFNLPLAKNHGLRFSYTHSQNTGVDEAVIAGSAQYRFYF